MKKLLLVLIVSCFFFYALANENVNKTKAQHTVHPFAVGCSPGTANADLDINNVRAKILQAGDMWWDLSNAKYEIPKNSGKHSMFAGALWIGGIDNFGQIRAAAHTYRQTGNDYWPGALDTTITDISSTRCLYYDQFWKLTKAEVQNFVTNGTTTPAILSWPGNGNNSSPTEGHYLAPFIDINGDGIYNTVDGDYPAFNLTGATGFCDGYLNGDQNIWWVFNDMGNIHTETNSQPIGLEIHAQAFSFLSSLDAINNATFYQYKIINRSSNTFDDTYFGHWADPDLGNAIDDYVGCDVTRGLGYSYNGDNDDDGAGGYGLNPPAIGIDFLQGPLADLNDGIDNDRDGTTDEPGEDIIMSKFIYYNNTNSTPTGNPDGFTDIYNYLRGIWLDNLPMTYGGDGRNPNAPQCNFMFPGTTDPVHFPTLGAWSEVTAGNPPADRRFLQSAGSFTLEPGEVNFITVGVPWARATTGGPLASVALLETADDFVQQVYDSCFNLTISINELVTESFSVMVSPNPFSAQAEISFSNPLNDEFSFIMFDTKGKQVRTIEEVRTDKIILRKEGLAQGIYFYELKNRKGNSFSGKIVVG